MNNKYKINLNIQINTKNSMLIRHTEGTQHLQSEIFISICKTVVCLFVFMIHHHFLYLITLCIGGVSYESS